MIIVMEVGATQEQEAAVRSRIHDAGLETKRVEGDAQNTISIAGTGFDKQRIETMICELPGIEKIVQISASYKIASRDFGDRSAIQVKRGSTNVHFNGDFAIMAGPCAIESEDQVRQSVSFLSGLGVKIFRGGAFKPRSSPYSFQGMGEEGLKIARKVCDEYGMLFVTEVVSTEVVPLIAEYADILQIGARNMQNFELLKAVGLVDMPVLLKRGLSATLDEFLDSAEYILTRQRKPNVILCLRGIRSFENDTRNTSDLGAVLSLKKKTWLPVVFDPSHATGKREFVGPTARMATVADYSGLMIETHPNPSEALSDGKQSLPFDQFSGLYQEIKSLANTVGKQMV